MLPIFPPSLSVFSDFAWDSGIVLYSVKCILLFFHCSVAAAQLLSHVQHFATPCTTVHQASLSFTISWSLLLIQGGFRKGRWTRDQIANICWVIEKEREFQKNTTASLPMLKPLTVWITIDCGTFLKRWEYQATLNAFGETCRQIKKQQLELNIMDWFKIRQRVHQGCIWSPCLFNLYTKFIMGNAWLDEAQDGIKIVGRNINNLRYTDDTTLMAESEEELNSLLMKVKEESEKVGL